MNPFRWLRIYNRMSSSLEAALEDRIVTVGELLDLARAAADELGYLDHPVYSADE